MYFILKHLKTNSFSINPATKANIKINWSYDMDNRIQPLCSLEYNYPAYDNSNG